MALIRKHQKILVFDLGGGTFDVSILEIGDGVFEVLATSGNNRLGGDDFDQRVMDWMADSFRQEYGIDLRNDKMAMQRLKEAAEKAKIELSTVAQTSINLPFITADASGPKHLDMTPTRAKFDEMTADLVEKTMGPTRQALADAGLSPNDIHRVLMVGGSTRIPAVQEAIRSSWQGALQGNQPGRMCGHRRCHSGGRPVRRGEGPSAPGCNSLSLGIETRAACSPG